MQLLRDNLVSPLQILLFFHSPTNLQLRPWTSSEAEPAADSGAAPTESKETSEAPPTTEPEKVGINPQSHIME
jgi:hypothetical protein